VIGAYGRRSRTDRDLERPFLDKLESCVGIKLHHRAAPGTAGQQALDDLAHTTEIYGLDGGYCGIARVENDTINVCMLLNGHAFARLRTNEWPQVRAFLSADNPALAQRLDALVPDDAPPITVAQMPFTGKEPAKHGILFIGDTAGMIAPLCGDGMAMALESGIMVAALVQDHLAVCGTGNGHNTAALDQLSQRWQQHWNTRFARRLKLGKALQNIMFRPAPAEVAMAVLKAAPASVPAALARLTRG
jgi:flavin-dependent dehydrogenase